MNTQNPNRAISAPITTKPLRVSTTLRLTQNTANIIAVCETTGICMELAIPAIKGYALTYTNPLALYKNANGLADRGHTYLQSTDTQILAGIFLTIYKHYGLIADSKQSAAEENAILRTAGKDYLVNAILLSKHIHSNNCHALPRYSLDYNSQGKGTGSIAPSLHEYTKLLRKIIFPPAIEEENPELAAYYAEQKALQATKKKTLGLSDAERAFEEDFKNNKREAKTLVKELHDIPAVPAKLTNFLKMLCNDRNMIVLDADVRSKLLAKMASFPLQQMIRLSAIIKASENPYDILGSALNTISTEDSDSALASTVRRKTLAEILAEKRANALSKAQDAVPTTEHNEQSSNNQRQAALLESKEF